MDAWVKEVLLAVGIMVLYELYVYFTFPRPGGTREPEMTSSERAQHFIEMWTVAFTELYFEWYPPSLMINARSKETGEILMSIPLPDDPQAETSACVQFTALDLQISEERHYRRLRPHENTPPTLTDEVAPPPPPSPRRWLPGRDSTGRLAPEFSGELRRADAPPPAPPPVSYPAGRRLNLRPRRDEDASGREG